jgi:hypothetical protein
MSCTVRRGGGKLLLGGKCCTCSSVGVHGWDVGYVMRWGRKGGDRFSRFCGSADFAAHFAFILDLENEEGSSHETLSFPF